MTRFVFILFSVLLYFASIDAQKYRLIESNHSADNSKDCRTIGNCIADKYLKNDTLVLTIYIDNNFCDLSEFRDTFSYCNDTLRLNLVDTAQIRRSIMYNSGTNKMDTFVTQTIIMSRTRFGGGYDTQRYHYKLGGITKLPKAFQFGHKALCDCPVAPIKYEVYKGDTINIINKSGQQDGLWIYFYDTGEILKKKYYKNGEFLHGYLYNKKGQITHKVSESCIEMAIPVEVTK